MINTDFYSKFAIFSFKIRHSKFIIQNSKFFIQNSYIRASKFKHMQISKFLYKGVPKICVHHPFAAGDIEKLRSIAGFTYSKTHLCWYLPYTNEAFAQLKLLFPELIVLGAEEKTPAEEQKPEIPAVTQVEATNPELQPEKEKTEPQNLSATIAIDKEHKRFFVKHTHHTQLWQAMRNLENGFWQREKKQWVFKGENMVYMQVKNALSGFGVVAEESFQQSLAEQETNATVKLFIESLTMKNYSVNTLECYLPHFRKFVQCFEQTQLISEINYTQIKDYIENEIVSFKLSETATRHLISAIKFYYEKVLGKQKMLFKLSPSYKIHAENYTVSAAELLPELDNINEPENRLFAVLKFGLGFENHAIANLTL
ncbi:MAG TPA: hypothetical protein DCQ31_12935, partial [Bacteroidales bacterium]|nr:hypothetical protein [Bacteroidales bacterium]